MDAYWLTVNGKALVCNGKVLTNDTSAPSLPPYTIRLKFTEGVTPTFSKGTAVQVSSSPNIWDLTYENTDWGYLCQDEPDLLEVIDANTSDVTYMRFMFDKCSSLTSVHRLDTASCTNMNYMFRECSALTSVPQLDTASCTSMNYMFESCTSLTTVPLFDTSSCILMTGMFESCTSLTTVPLFDTSHVEQMGDMFHLCTSLTTVPLFDTSSVKNMSFMLATCTSLASVPLFDTSSVKNMISMCQKCYNVQSGALALYQQASSQTTPPTDYVNAFTNCGRDTTTGAAELAQIPTNWGGTGA